MNGLQVNETIKIREDEIEERFIHSPGPGGQHVNKAATGVQLRFNLLESPSLPEPVRARAQHLAGRRLNKEGFLIIEAHSYRSLDRNRQEARWRLAHLLRQATQIPRRRVKSRAPRSAHEKRLKRKRRQSDKKLRRRPVDY
jgi:ribosome-associated protein